MKAQVAHIMQDNTWYLNRGIVPNLIKLLPESRIYLCKAPSNPSEKISISNNQSWIDVLGKEQWGGTLEEINWQKRLRWLYRPLRIRLGLILPSYTFATWIHILKGPKNWLFHGVFVNCATAAIFRLFGKCIAMINWAGPTFCSDKTPIARMESFKWRFCSAVFNLISPENRYFKGLLPDEKVITLPYPSLSSASYDEAIQHYCQPDWNPAVIVGNNALRMAAYGPLLDKFPSKGWHRIVCMLNYGSGGAEWRQGEDVEAFDQKYREKFGEAWFAWRDVLPYDEYARIMAECPIYCCPMSTQSGVGALALSIRQGKGIIARGDNLAWLKDIGVSVTDLDQISDFSPEELLKVIPSKELAIQNIINLRRAYFETYGASYWRSVVSKVFSL